MRKHPAGTSGLVQNKISIMTGKDLLVAISFGRCLRETVEAVKRAAIGGRCPHLASRTVTRRPMARPLLRPISNHVYRAFIFYRFVRCTRGRDRRDPCRVRTYAANRSL